MGNWKRDFKYSLLVGLVVFLVNLSKMTPRKILQWSYQFIAWLGFYCVPKYRKSTIKNIQYIYPEKSPKELAAFAKQVYLNMGRNYADLVRGYSIKSTEDFKKKIDVIGAENLDNAYKKGKGVIALTCHMGAYELIAAYCALNYDSIGVGVKLKHDKLNKMLVDFRENWGGEFIYRGEGTIKMLKHLKRGGLLVILTDQDSKRMKNTFVDFLGKKAATPVGASLLALKTGCEVVPMAMSLQNGKQTLEIRPSMSFEATGDEEKDIKTISTAFNKELGGFIMSNPTQWIWMHERWKSKEKA